MTAWMANRWDRLRTGFWFVPGLLALAAVGLGLGMPSVDAALGQWVAETQPWLATTPASAGRTLSAFGGAIVGATGVVFSTTMVVLSLASQQFGPRLLRTFLTDRTTQVTLGAFVGTSLYCLLVLRVIREVEGNPVAPDLSVQLGVLLSVLTIGQLVYFIHHLATRIQAPQVVRAVARDLDAAIDRLFPDRIGSGPAGPVGQPSLPPGEPQVVRCPEDGYLQAIDSDGLMRLAREQDSVIEVNVRPGDFVSRGEPVARVRRADGRPTGDEASGRLEGSFLLGPSRTPRQDPECAIAELVEVAVRALSPGINDPFTAMSCVDYLGAALGRLAGREMPSRYRFDDEGKLRIVADPYSFESALNAAFDQIRQDARRRVDVTIRGLEALGEVARRADRPDRKRVIRRQAEMYRRNAEAAPEPNDREDIEARFDAVRQALGDKG